MAGDCSAEYFTPILAALVKAVLGAFDLGLAHDMPSGGAEPALFGPGPIAANANILKVASAGPGAMLAWPALLCKRDRENPGYAS